MATVIDDIGNALGGVAKRLQDSLKKTMEERADMIKANTLLREDTEKEVNMKYGDKVFSSTLDEKGKPGNYQINGESVDKDEFQKQLKEAGFPSERPEYSTLEAQGTTFSRAQKDNVTMDNIEANGHSYEHVHTGNTNPLTIGIGNYGKDTYSIDGKDVSREEFTKSLNKDIAQGGEKNKEMELDSFVEDQKKEMEVLKKGGSLDDLKKEEEKTAGKTAGTANKGVSDTLSTAKDGAGKVSDIGKQISTVSEKMPGVGTGAGALATPAVNGPKLDTPGLSK